MLDLVLSSADFVHAHIMLLQHITFK